MHHIKDCPHNSDKNSDDRITLYQSNITPNQMNVLIGECFSCGLLDSGCPETVCGRAWLKCFKDSLSENERNLIKESKSENTFRFGKGDVVKSLKRVIIPANLGGRNVYITTDVVETDIPLLISRELMKKAEAVLDFNRDTITLFGAEEKLHFTTSGHYAIPLNKSRIIVDKCERGENLKNEEIVFIADVTKNVEDNSSDKENEAMVRKLHRQFCHCSPEKLKRLMKSSGMFDEKVLKMVDKIHDECKVCKIYKKAPPRPVVGLPLSSDFNHTVSMDLVHFNDKWILTLFLDILLVMFVNLKIKMLLRRVSSRYG